MTLLDFLLLSLAAWRLASLLAREDGPYDLLGRLRARLGVRYDERSEPYGTNVIAKAVICVFCSSVWLGAGLAIFYYLAPDRALWLSLPLAISAAAVLVEKYV